MAETLSRFDLVMRQRIDAGEAEAITLLCRCEDETPQFCAADRAAVRAACLLGFGDRVISLEAILRRVGLDRPHLADRYSQKRVRQWVAEGREQRLRGEGLAGS